MKMADVMQGADWKTEKHATVIEAPEKVSAGEIFTVDLCVGKEIPHPNTTEHNIRWIKLYFKPDNGKFVYEIGSYEFSVHGESVEGANKGPAYTEPVAKAVLKINNSGTLLATSYCNIHGLWESSKAITVQG